MELKYGVTVWGNYFLEAIYQYYADIKRLQRGLRYANSDRVKKIEINNTLVLAKVKGNQGRSYTVSLYFSPFKSDEKEKVVTLIEDNLLVLGEIIKGNLPDILLDELTKNNIKLFPSDWKELNRGCSCPDWGDPCKHMAAVYYLLTREIDLNPFLLFTLRGLDLTKLFKITTKSLIDYPINIQEAHENQYNNELQSFREVAIVTINNYTNFILSKLSNNPSFIDKDFKPIIEKFYKKSQALSDAILLRDIASMDSDLLLKLENLFKSGKISFIPDKNFVGSYFTFYSELIEHEPVRQKIDSLNIMVYDAKTSTYHISPLNMLKLFLQFTTMYESNESTSECLMYNFLFILSRVAYNFVKSNAFIPAVYLEKNQFYCIFRLLSSPVDIKKQIHNVISAMPVSLTLPSLTGKNTKKSRGTMDKESTIKFMLACFFTEYASIIGTSMKSSLKLTKQFHSTMYDAIFLSKPYSMERFNDKALPLAIANYFSIFELIESNLDFSVIIDKHNDEYFLQFLVNNTTINQITEQKTKNIVLKVLSNFIDVLPEIPLLLKNSTLPVSQERLEDLITKKLELLQNLGVEVLLPKELKEIIKPQLKIKTRLKDKTHVSFFSLNDMVTFDYEFYIDNETISYEELIALMNQNKELLKFRDSYIRINTTDIAKLMQQYETKSNLSQFDLLKSHLSNESETIELCDEIKAMFETMFTEQQYQLPHLNASLREYQERGFNWMLHLLLHGFGVILADDMGLGKTLQAIAVIQFLKENGYIKKPMLIVVPKTLMFNWESEIKKFSENLSYTFYYGTKRTFSDTDIIFTTYETLQRDYKKLEDIVYDGIILDEAQKIKNYQTLTAKAIKHLSKKAKFRIALSGTPIENRLTELWSIFDFILPGYLKSIDYFVNEYTKEIELKRNQQKIENLRKITSPFILRRLKTDKSIIKDLPEKIIIDQFVEMEKEQIALYEHVVQQLREEIAASENLLPIILKSFTILKQICNHPRNYDKKSPAISHISGKTKLLLEILPAIIAKQEKVLIFTQFVEMGNILKQIIENELLSEPLFLTGNLSQIKRKELIEKFEHDDSAQIFILSLKAGGVGLNLTKANHVIHYDLWYNPSVENQATDRAFRIGQKKNVFVHRFVTKSSFEEKINAMIQ
ncbi:MAG TPA: SNF2-related protein, partial [Spirochaetota bacterium]|nr:SNF2-related protein [Spirochaetota bacterium]